MRVASVGVGPAGFRGVKKPTATCSPKDCLMFGGILGDDTESCFGRQRLICGSPPTLGAGWQGKTLQCYSLWSQHVYLVHEQALRCC